MKKARVSRIALLCALAFLCGALLPACAKPAAESAAPLTPDSARIAVVVGTTSEAAAEKLYPGAEILKFDALSDAATSLQSDKADFVITAYSNAVNFARHNSDLAVLPDKLSDDACSIAFNKSETELLSKVDELLARYGEDGTLDAIVDSWMRTDGTDYANTEIPELEDAPELNIAISADREPMCFVLNGEYAGLDVELAKQLAYDMGYRPVFSDMKFSAMIPSVVSGKTPMAISNIAATDERRESVSFSTSYYSNPQVLLTTKEIASKHDGADPLLALDGKPVGILTGTVFDKTAALVLPNSKQLFFNNNSDVAVAVKQGKIASFLSDEPVARLMVARDGDLAMLPQLVNKEDYAFAFSKTETGLRFRDQMNEYLTKLRADGTLEKLEDEWFNGVKNDIDMGEADAIVGKNGTLRLGSNFEQEPFDYIESGKHVGYEMDLLAGFCREYGYTLDISTANFDALIPGLVSEVYDVTAACITITEERAQSVAFSDPIYNGGVAVVVAAGTLSSVDNAAVPPETARIGALTGTTCEAAALEKYPNADNNSFSALNDCMTALKAGQLDYAAVTETDAVNYIRSDSGFEIYGEPLRQSSCSAAIAKNQPDLLEKLNELLAKYREDGTLARMKEHWIRPDGSDYIIDEVPVLADAPVLLVGTCAGFEPTGFYLNGEITGYDVELSKRIAYDLGMRAEFTDMAFNALIPALQSGKVDIVLANMAATKERGESVDFTQPYYETGLVMVRYVTESAAEKDFFESLSDSFEKNFVREERWKLLASGIGITLLISICSAIFGSAVGFGLCLVRRGRAKLSAGLSKAFIRIIQGTPVVVLLMILYYVVFNKTGLDGVAVAVIAFGINFGAYAAEILKSGIDAIDVGQTEAAAAIGFNSSQTFRMIILPQAARHFLPVLKGEFISLVKMTSVVGYVAVQDLTKASDIIRSRTYEAFFPLIVTAIIYFFLSWGLSSLLSLVEVRIDPKRRKKTAPDDAKPDGGDEA